MASDEVFSDTPAIDGGETSAQIFVGTESLVTDVCGMKSGKQFVNTLLDNITKRGAMTKLVTDSAKVETSNKVNDVLRHMIIGAWQSEPHMQHQNPAERRWQTVKRLANTIMDRTGSPACLWLLALTYVCFVLNHTAAAVLNCAVPLTVLTGQMMDISPLLRFEWYEPVFYSNEDSGFPSESGEKLGRFVGIEENVGHVMTFKILTEDTNKVINRSAV